MTPTRSIDTLLPGLLLAPAVLLTGGWQQAPPRFAGRGLCCQLRGIKPLRSSRLPLGSVELTLFCRAGQRGRRRGRVDGGRDPVEVTGTDLALVLGSGVTALLGRELALLQLDVVTHLVAGIAVGQIEHRVVQGVEAGQRDELELEAHRAEFLLEPRDG